MSGDKIVKEVMVPNMPTHTVVNIPDLSKTTGLMLKAITDALGTGLQLFPTRSFRVLGWIFPLEDHPAQAAFLIRKIASTDSGAFRSPNLTAGTSPVVQ
ncbi:MAG: hypothetical protein HQL78_01995 [Magnetococcales bacterium]|nr:hypothetical protein [Magnetococcales bacterium]